MQKALLFFIILLFVAGTRISAQNLFPNPGFELYDQCPDMQTQISRCADWDSAFGTADFYHCGFYLPTSVGTYGIPQSGSGVLGFAVAAPNIFAPNIRFYGEFIQANLAEELKPGAQYKVDVNLLFNSVNMPPPTPGCFDMGFYFYKSGHLPEFAINDCPPVKPHIRIGAAETTTNSYKTFTWNWTADSCYDRVAIGFFCNDSTFGTYCINNSSSVYYFDIDNVSMTKIADSPTNSFGFTSDKVEGCTEDCFLFIDNSSTKINSYEWFFEGANPATSILKNPGNICYSNSGTFDVTCIVHYECGNDTIIKTDYIKINPFPTVDLRADSMPQCTGVPIELTANSNAAVTWQDGLIADSLIVRSNGLFTVIAENNCGAAYDTLNVFFKKCMCSLYLPDAFSPNNDVKNDHYKAVFNCEITSYKMSIWNRWGQQVFISSHPDASWDGTYNGSPCPEGVYTLLVEYKGYAEEKLDKISKRKSISLIR